MRTCDIAWYAVFESEDGGLPGVGRGKEVITILNAVWGTDVSIFEEVVIMVSLSIRGVSISNGSRVTRGAMLYNILEKLRRRHSS